MLWVPVAVWCFGAVLAVVVLGFAAYELHWKAARLESNLRRLDAVNAQLRSRLDEVRAASERLAAAGANAGGRDAGPDTAGAQ